MSRDASGNFNLAPGNPVIPDTVIETAWANPTMADIAAGLTDSLSRSGLGGMGAPLAMGGYRITALGAAMLAADAPQATQIRDTTFNRLVTAASDSTGNNYNGTALINTPVVDGTLYLFVADKANTGQMTLAVNGGAPAPILMNGGPIPPGIILTGAVIGVMYLNLAWRLTNTAGIVGTVNSVQSDNLQAISVTNDFTNSVAVLNIHTNVPNGLAQLDTNAKLSPSQMPFSTLTFIGQWNATAGTLPPPAENGQVYLITGAGTLLLYRPDAPGSNNYTAQATAVAVSDQILYKKPASTGQPEGWYYSPAPSSTATAANVSVIPTPHFLTANNAQAWFNQADPVIDGKLNKSGGALTGDVTQTAAPAGPTSLVTQGYVLGQIAGIPAAVNSFNTRTGAVVLLSADISTALGYVPVNPAAPNFTATASAPGFNSTGFFTGLGFSPTALISTVGGSASPDYNSGQSKIFTISVGGVNFLNFLNIPPGGIMRLTLINTNNGVTWPATVAWPLGSTPDLTLGPLKKAVVVLENDGTKLLASSNAY